MRKVLVCYAMSLVLRKLIRRFQRSRTHRSLVQVVARQSDYHTIFLQSAQFYCLIQRAR